MLEDKLLVLKCRRGNKEAMCRIYEKYKKDFLRLAALLSNNASDGEDIA